MKLFLSLSISACTLFVSGAWNTQQQPEQSEIPLTTISSAVPNISAERYTPKMWTNTATLYKGETLVLHFKTPNASCLGVVDPKGHFFYLVFPAEYTVGALTPLVESKQFLNLKTLNINTSLLQADPYTDGVYTNQPVFTQSGTYTFILGENLHVDDPDLLDQAPVRYVHSPRPTPLIAVVVN